MKGRSRVNAQLPASRYNLQAGVAFTHHDKE